MTDDPLSGNKISLGQCSAGDKRKEDGGSIPHYRNEGLALGSLGTTQLSELHDLY